MKRLTYRLEDQCGNPTDSIILESDLIPLNSSETWKKVLSRLAAYEETGLEPEEIELLAKQRDLYVDACGELPLQRIRELAQADREGRCVILPKEEPLKRGMTIWYVDTDTGEIEEGEVFSTDYKDGRLDGFSVDFKVSGDFDEFFGSAWGSCFFGSRELAEAALRREQDDKW